MTDPRLLSAGLILCAIVLLGLAAILIFRGNPSRGERHLAPRPGKAIGGRTKVLSGHDILVLEALIACRGMNPARLLPVIISLRAVFLIAVPALGFACAHARGFSASKQIAAFFVCVALAVLISDLVLAWPRRAWRRALRQGMPDALDLLVVCTEAGMALESALDDVSRLIRSGNPMVSAMLRTLLNDLLTLPDRREAFRNFVARAGIEDSGRFVAAAVQSMRSATAPVGPPPGLAPRTIAADFRRKRTAAVKVAAARLSVLLMLPPMVFAVVLASIVLAGPAATELIDFLAAVARDVLASG